MAGWSRWPSKPLPLAMLCIACQNRRERPGKSPHSPRIIELNGGNSRGISPWVDRTILRPTMERPYEEGLHGDIKSPLIAVAQWLHPETGPSMFEFVHSSQADSKAIDGFCTIGLCLKLGLKKTSFCHVKLPKVGDFLLRKVSHWGQGRMIPVACDGVVNLVDILSLQPAVGINK